MSKKKKSRRNKKPRGAKSPRKTIPAPPPKVIAPRPYLKIGVVAAAFLVVAAAAFFLIPRPKKTAVVRDGNLNVVLITLDTTRADRLGCYGYAQGRTPNLDAVARNGVLFSNAYAQVPLTLPSHASLMTGLNPAAHGVHNNGTYILSSEKATLAKILKANGYKTAAFIASFSVDSRFGLDQGFDLYDDNLQENSPFKALNSERKAEQVFAPFAAWFDTLKEEKFFCWVHFFDPHLPYSPPVPYSDQFAGRPYDGEIAYVDFLIGSIMRKIREKNILGRTLVVIAGDHGEAFGEKGEAGHGVFLYDMTLRVPLILLAESHLPSIKTIPARVRLIDVMPTILDMVNLPPPPGIQGTSLVPFIQGKKKTDLETVIETVYPKENFNWAPLAGLISGRWKYIRAPKEELYDLRVDPAESQNLFSTRPKEAAELRAGLEKSIKESLVPGSSGKRALSAEEQDRLRSLGYIDYSDKTAGGREPDPKDKIDELRMVQDAEKFEFDGNYRAAAELHEKMLTLRPGAASSYINLALARARLGDFDAAIRTLKLGIEKIPNSTLLLSRLGYTYFVTGKTEEALAAMAEVLKIDPRYIDALTATAVIFDGRGEKDKARDYYERGLAIEPENKFLRLSYAQNLAEAGRIAEAVDLYTRLTKDYPQDPTPYQLLGVTYLMVRDFDKAVENLREAMFIKPSPPVYYYLAMASKEKGDLPEAVRYLELYLEDPKGEPEARVRNARSGLESLKKAINK
jgi:arylsulfatase A-like enzyme/tetratricopeptide (TPR) repeat protein